VENLVIPIFEEKKVIGAILEILSLIYAATCRKKVEILINKCLFLACFAMYNEYHINGRY
jgi:hypothetical protein